MIKAWDYVYDKCKNCGQNLPGTGRSVTNYLGNNPMSYNELEKIRYVHHKTLTAIEDAILLPIADKQWFVPAVVMAEALGFLYLWLVGII